MCSGWLCGGLGQFGVFGVVSVQRVALWWVWDSLDCGWGSECAASGFDLCVGVSKCTKMTAVTE